MSFRARLLIIGFFSLIAVVCLLLGFWQVDRLKQRRTDNVAALKARSAPPVPLREGTAMSRTLDGREVWAVGHYDHPNDVVLRGKAYRGSPGVEIVSPLVLEGGKTAVLVNRGFVPSPDAMTVQTDSVREFGRVRVKGTALPVPSGSGAPLERNGGTTWTRLDLEALSERVPYRLAPVYIRQAPDSSLPVFPLRLEPPAIDDGPHLNYAIQWFAFAAMAMVFGAVILKSGEEKA